jgi:hypothetical protein
MLNLKKLKAAEQSWWDHATNKPETNKIRAIQAAKIGA